MLGLIFYFPTLGLYEVSTTILTLANGAIQKHLNKTFKAAAIMLPSQILNIGRVSF